MKIKRKLGINTDCMRDIADEITTLKLAHAAGFEAITTCLTDFDKVSSLKACADEFCMEFPFLHAPFSGINAMWLEGEGYRGIFDGMIKAVDTAAACGVGAVVAHVSSGWQAPPVNDLGLSRFDSFVNYAAEKGVIVAFENLRMLGNLAYLTDRYENNSGVRFCFDAGHEHCYTKTVSWLDVFTHRLLATHIHDNLGRPFEDKISDRDTHWLPFDGNYNYHEMMRKLDLYGFEGVLMLEVFHSAREDYKKMSAEQFIATAYERIKRISEL